MTEPLLGDGDVLASSHGEKPGHTEPPPLPDAPLTLVFDGSSIPKNPGGVALSAYALLHGDEVVHSGIHEVCRGPSATNNVAEWAALVAGIRFLHQSAWRNKLLIRGDSQLVIRQLNLEYRCKQPHLKVFLDEAHRLLGAFVWQADWVNRELNTLPDQMIRDHWEGIKQDYKPDSPA